MYGARKSGKKKDSLPAFEKGQMLAQTGLRNFCLVPATEKHEEGKSKGSLKSIETAMSVEGKTKH